MESVTTARSVTKEYGSKRILCVFPSYHGISPAPYHHCLSLVGFGSSIPPLGLLVIAAVLPSSWQVRLVDENIRLAADEDFVWADVVFVSGMHPQRRQMQEIRRRAHEVDRIVVLGGPSVSASPENYPEFDYLHIGELGDATDELIERLASNASRPEQQVVLTTNVRRALTDFPLPAYELVELDRYMVCSIQFSSGCPYECDFCDIPALYGRVPRMKTPAQVLAELDKIVACGATVGVYFVDDNFIANRRATRELLPHLIDWQKRNGYPLALTCEATLNIAKRPEILALMREAFFIAMFCGIESPDPSALKAMAKVQNYALPIPVAVQTINSYGIEICSGIIIGLDTDTPDTGERILQFAEVSQIPNISLNLLQALPRTPLWDRLQRERRVVDDETRESNVVFRLPYNQVVGMWRDCMRRAYQPAAVFRRFEHQARATYPNRIRSAPAQQLTWKNVGNGFRVLGRIIWRLGLRGDYRREFWRFAFRRVIRGQFVVLLGATTSAYHLIRYAAEASSGRTNSHIHLWRIRLRASELARRAAL